MQENAAQDIRQNKIFRGNMQPEPPPTHLAKLLSQICSLYCIGQILGLDPALMHEYLTLGNSLESSERCNFNILFYS